MTKDKEKPTAKKEKKEEDEWKPDLSQMYSVEESHKNKKDEEKKKSEETQEGRQD